jgi:succinate-semialdehyde dehydrogenase/glutarate-semialdehyde dehydrogenase
MHVGGQLFTPERDTRTYESPSTGVDATTILLGDASDVDRAVAAARVAQPIVEAMGLDARAELLDQTCEAIMARQEEFAQMLAVEHGKPVSEARGEVAASAGAMAAAGAQARWMTESHYPLSTPGKRLLTHRRPRGVYGILTPWNFPLGIGCQYYFGPGLAAGNTIVWVGAPSVTGVHALLVETIAPLWPAGAINLVTGDGSVVGQALASHSGVDAVGFTGSTQVGKKVHAAAAGKPAFLELGGNGPTIVLPDADIERAAAAIAGGTFTNAGQICTATGRILAHESVAAQLSEAIAAQSEKFKIGDPREEATSMGPVHQTSLVERILSQLDQAVSDGAKIVTGGTRANDLPTPNYLLPTVVDNVGQDSDLHRIETFGPVAPVVHYSTDEELFELLDKSTFGLHGAVFSRDVERAIGLAEKLRVGHVNINDTSAYWETSIPAGGAAGRASGVGRAGGPWSVLEMTEVQTIAIESK